MGEKRKRRFGDRKDASWVRDGDPIHAFMPYIMLGRASNEAVLDDEVDLSAVTAYLEKKNAGDVDFKYTIFHVVLAALAKTVYLRPAMNRYLQGHRTYQRHDISFAFVIKRVFADNAEEGMIIMKVDQETDTGLLEQIHGRIKKEVNAIRREGGTDGTSGVVAKLNALPRPLLRFVARILFWLDYHGWLPKALEAFDPFHASCFVTNLGSIKMTADYHHLVDWGTNSFFVIIGEKKWKPVFKRDGSYEMKELLPLGFTVDERISDGFYFAKSIKILRAILRRPEILDEPIFAPVEFEEGEI